MTGGTATVDHYLSLSNCKYKATSEVTSSNYTRIVLPSGTNFNTTTFECNNVEDFDAFNRKGRLVFKSINVNMNNRSIMYGISTPSKGVYKVGDIVYNTDFSTNKFIGWVYNGNSWSKFGALL